MKKFFSDGMNIAFMIILTIFVVSVSWNLATGKDMITETLGISPIVLTIGLGILALGIYFGPSLFSKKK